MSESIDRQQAIEAVELGITYAKLIDTETGELLEPFKASNDELKRAVQRIKNLPSAEPKRIRGKWIHDGGKWKNRWICSECGYKWFFDCIEGAYCPNCGADMRGEQDG